MGPEKRERDELSRLVIFFLPQKTSPSSSLPPRFALFWAFFSGKSGLDRGGMGKEIPSFDETFLSSFLPFLLRRPLKDVFEPSRKPPDPKLRARKEKKTFCQLGLDFFFATFL